MWARMKEELFYLRNCKTENYTVEELKTLIWRYYAALNAAAQRAGSATISPPLRPGNIVADHTKFLQKFREKCVKGY